MNVLIIILSILLILGGIAGITTPLITFFELGYIVMFLLIVYGVMAIVKAVTEKKYGIDFVFGILSVIAGVVAAILPGMGLSTDMMLLVMAAVWLIVQGIMSIMTAFQLKKSSEGKKWIWGLVLGILGIILGLYSFIHPIVLAFTMGMLLGIYFIESGLSMIFMTSQNDQ